MGTITTTAMIMARKRFVRDGSLSRRHPEVRPRPLEPGEPRRATARLSPHGEQAAETGAVHPSRRAKRRAPQDHGAATALAAPALYRLMAWLSPAYPIGAFSYSSGIEWAVEAGDIADATTLERWLAVIIADGSGFCDAVFLSACLPRGRGLRRGSAARGRRAGRRFRAVEGAATGDDGPGPRLPRHHACSLAHAGARPTARGLGWRSRAAGRGRCRERRT